MDNLDLYNYLKFSKPPRMLKRELVFLIEELRELISISEMKNAGFGMGDEKDPTEYIKNITRLYRETWLVSPMRLMLKRYEFALELYYYGEKK